MSKRPTAGVTLLRTLSGTLVQARQGRDLALTKIVRTGGQNRQTPNPPPVPHALCGVGAASLKVLAAPAWPAPVGFRGPVQSAGDFPVRDVGLILKDTFEFKVSCCY
jgi:hypothetical protein